MGSCSCLNLKNTIPTIRAQLRFTARDDKCIAWTRLGMLFGKDEKKHISLRKEATSISPTAKTHLKKGLFDFFIHGGIINICSTNESKTIN